MKNLRIGKKLLVTFGIIIAMLCITVIIATASLFQVRNNFTIFYEKPFVINNYAMDMRRSLQNMAKSFGYATMSTDLQDTAKYIQAARDELTSLQEGTSFMQEYFSGDKALISKFEDAMTSITDAREQAFAFASENKNDQAIDLFFSVVQPGLAEAQDYLIQIETTSLNTAKAQYTTADRTSAMATVLLICIALVALLVTTVLAFYLTRSLTQPLKEIEVAANDMAAGTLNVQVTYTSQDELGSVSNSIRKLITNLQGIIGDVDYLLDEISGGNFTVQSRNPDGYVGDFTSILMSMRRLRDRLNRTLSQIGQASDQVSSGSDQVSSSAQALSQGATEQASSVEELAATINEISEQVHETAQNTAQARDEMNSTENEINLCNSQMQRMIASMGDIGKKSSEIGKIIKTIEDIAFQTNILALNAAVEAARAGVAGKGFAVVADEVRNLASKSAEASQNTAALIEGAVHAIDEGTGIANETAQSLVKVVDSSQAVASIVDNIANAANLQATSIAQITQGIDQISSVVQTNSATAEESAAASEELSGQAQLMKNLVGQFTLYHADRQPLPTSSESTAVNMLQ